MSELDAPTFEEAKLCPKCALPGEDMGASVTTNSRGNRVTVHMVFCRNEACSWFNTNWIIQVNPDGSIPKPYSQIGNKLYPKLSQESAAKLEAAIQAQLRAETSPGGAEVRNPHG